MNDNLEMSVFELDIPVRLMNALEGRAILTVHDLLMKRPEEITSIPNVGTRSLEQIYKALSKIGFHRKTSVVA